MTAAELRVLLHNLDTFAQAPDWCCFGCDLGPAPVREAAAELRRVHSLPNGLLAPPADAPPEPVGRVFSVRDLPAKVIDGFLAAAGGFRWGGQ